MISFLDIGYRMTETLKANRCKKYPLETIATIKEEPRGTIKFVADTENKIMVFRCIGKSVVKNNLQFSRQQNFIKS